jgi:NAD(P)-dependent dehydrogenase (short-subunit alcohol dehydrogenase family)
LHVNYCSLGYETALHYARNGVARLILASRNMSKLEDAKGKIGTDLPSFKGDIETWQLDQANFASVRAFCDRMEGLDRLDCVVFNAGTAHRSWVETEEGYEDTYVKYGTLTSEVLKCSSWALQSADQRNHHRNPSSPFSFSPFANRRSVPKQHQAALRCRCV